MRRYDKIPSADPDFARTVIEIAEHYQNAYFAVRIFCAKEINRAEFWRVAALTGWFVAGLTILVSVIKS
jgi:hypothetical protein